MNKAEWQIPKLAVMAIGTAVMTLILMVYAATQ